MYLVFVKIGEFIFTIETEKFPMRPNMKLNVITNYFKCGIQLSLNGTPVNTREEKCYKTLHSFKTSLSTISLVKGVNRLDFIISKQVSPVTVLVFLWFVVNLNFASEIKFILSKDANLMGASEENALFIQFNYWTIQEQFNYCIYFGKFICFELLFMRDTHWSFIVSYQN